MKKAGMIVIMVVILFTMSCDMRSIDEKVDEIFYERATGHSLYYLPAFESLDSFTKIAYYIDCYVSFRPDEPGKDIWSGPETTLSRGYGDCEDIALLFANIAYFSLNIKMNVAIVSLSDGTINRAIVDGGTDLDHVVLKYNNKIYEAQNGFEYIYTSIKYIYTFDEVFSK